MQFDSEFLIIIFPSERRMGLPSLFDVSQTDGIKSDFGIRWLKSSDFGPNSDDSIHRNIKSQIDVFVQVQI